MNLAEAELYLILVKLLWHFDCQRPQGISVDETEEWEKWIEKQSLYFLYVKGPLMVSISRRKDI